MFKTMIAFLLVAVMLLLPCNTPTVTALSEDEISAPSAVLMDANTGKILIEKNSHDQRPCASITKVMTLLLVMEALDEGKIHMGDIVTTSAHAASMGGSDIWLEEGEQMTVDMMIKATVVASANDAAVALAEHICGTEDDFVRKMNERAKQLGMNDTTFLNCNGLDEDGHITSAYDVALMSRELIRHPEIFNYTSIWLDYLRDGKTQIVNTNKLLKTYRGITGLKTGTTGKAGSCITATAERDSLSLIAVVLGAETGAARFKDAATLLDHGFANYETAELKPNSKMNSLKVEGGMTDSVDIACEGVGYITVEKGHLGKTEQRAEIPESIEAPVTSGDKVGAVHFFVNGEEVASFDVVATENVEKKTFGSVFSLLWNTLMG